MTRCFLFSYLLVLTVLCAGVAHAQCVPGIPCFTSATVNLPNNLTDGPNAAGAPNATKSDSAACDADFMNQIYARAFLEASRENVMNETVIRKPDSVLELSCFDQYVRNITPQAESIFSGDPYTSTLDNDFTLDGSDNPIEIDIDLSGELGTDVGPLILDSLNSYINANFGHTYLGGTVAVPAPGGGGSFNCPFMNSVYFAAKCNNFGADDRFLSFSTLVTLDPRALPSVCPAAANAFTNNIIAVAENRNFAHVNFDRVNNYLERMVPDDCDDIDPVPTGVMVTVVTAPNFSMGGLFTSTPETYEEKTCPNPSCYYDRSSDECAQ